MAADYLIKLINIFCKLSSKMDSQYLYHETKIEYLQDIKRLGLLPTSYGQSLVQDDGTILSPDEMLVSIREELEDDEYNSNLNDEEFEELVNSKFEELVDPLDLTPRTYVMKHKPTSYNYGDMLLRFASGHAVTIYKDVDFYITVNILPEFLEVYNNGKWIDLSHMENL